MDVAVVVGVEVGEGDGVAVSVAVEVGVRVGSGASEAAGCANRSWASTTIDTPSANVRSMVLMATLIDRAAGHLYPHGEVREGVMPDQGGNVD